MLQGFYKGSIGVLYLKGPTLVTPSGPLSSKAGAHRCEVLVAMARFWEQRVPGTSIDWAGRLCGTAHLLLQRASEILELDTVLRQCVSSSPCRAFPDVCLLPELLLAANTGKVMRDMLDQASWVLASFRAAGSIDRWHGTESLSSTPENMKSPYTERSLATSFTNLSSPCLQKWTSSITAESQRSSRAFCKASEPKISSTMYLPTPLNAKSLVASILNS